MTESKRATRSDLKKVDAHKIASAEYDEAPVLSDRQLKTARLEEGGQVVKRGRPKSDVVKEAVKLRLDPDVLAHFRKAGPGWQTQINLALRKSAKLGKAVSVTIRDAGSKSISRLALTGEFRVKPASGGGGLKRAKR